MTLIVPLLAIVFLNVSVYMTARRQINATEFPMGGSPVNAEVINSKISYLGD